MRIKTKLWLVGLAAALVTAAAPMSAGATTGTFTSAPIGPIADDSTTARTVTVSGLPGVITDVNATINDVGTQDPSQFDVLLVNPNGGSVILMSDAGGTAPVPNADVSFDDAALGPVPDPLVTGTYTPTNLGVDADTFTGAPAGPYGSTLAALNGSNANAVWTLYITDDASGGLPVSGAGTYALTVTTNASGTPTTGPKPKKAKKKKKCKPKKGKGTVGKKPKKCKPKKGRPHR